MKKRSEAEFRQKGDFGVQFRWKEVAKKKKNLIGTILELSEKCWLYLETTEI